MSPVEHERYGFRICKRWSMRFPAFPRSGKIGGKQRRSSCYFVVREVESGRASGCFEDQSSGGNATRQNVGRGSENSSPISALPPRTQEEQECHVAFLGTVRGGK